MTIQSTNTTATITMPGDNTNLVIVAGVYVSTAGYGVYTAHTSDTIANFGNVISSTDGVFLDGSNSGLASQLFNAASGYIFGTTDAVLVSERNAFISNAGGLYGQFGVVDNAGGIEVNNSGHISSSSVGVQANGNGDSVVNSGLIDGGNYGVETSEVAGNYTTVSNSGTIQGAFDAIGLSGGQGSAQVVNTGVLIGAVELGGATTTSSIANSGVIDGYIDLGAGADLYDGHAGSVSGPVTGGAGNDTLIGGVGDDTLVGGAGRDKLDGFKTGSDTFTYLTVADSTPGVMDVIAKHFNANDLFDLSALDAFKHTAGHQDLTFGTQVSAGDSLTTGVVDFYQQGGDTYVVADTDGDHVADFAVKIHGAFTLTAGEFVL